MRRWLVCLLSVLLLGTVGCGDAASPPETEEPPVLQIADFLTAEDVEQATGFAVGAPITETDGSAAYLSANGSAAVYLAMQPADAAAFDAMTAAVTANGHTLTEAPNLGDKAVWCEALNDLLVLARGYALDVRVEYATARSNDSLIAARHLAALLIEHL